ncbi:hypothetical protein RJ639_044681 [Escallonia herrerae]|uniref:Retroviral polymerase SH3-like domain-containing protein n=1 Tax=Escallonia herrerae TaxID=1293975 RepID=A0AA88WDG0_9ASTE|nr:hypothetical protein RJ639_044681 [Escallonia herrerae]
MNRTIVERVQCMLRMSKLPKEFWGEAARTACYVINRSPSAPLGFKISEKVWTGNDLSYFHVKVFGCKAFAHVPKEHRSKLDDKASPCIFLGYGDAEFGYRLWDPEKKKLVRSRDVVFHDNENITNFDKASQPKNAGISKLKAVPSSSSIVTNGRDINEEGHDIIFRGTKDENEANIEGNAQDQQPSLPETVQQGEHSPPPEVVESQATRRSIYNIHRGEVKVLMS